MSDKPYKQSSDVWSLGILLYELCCLTPPFQGSNFNDLCDNIKLGEYEDIPIFYSEELGELIASMLNKDPILRPTVNDILCHPLMKKPCIDFIKSDVFKEEYLYLAKFIKRKEEDSKEEEVKTSKSKKSLSREEMLYKEYVNKIEEMIDPPEECKPAKKSKT